MEVVGGYVQVTLSIPARIAARSGSRVLNISIYLQVVRDDFNMLGSLSNVQL